MNKVIKIKNYVIYFLLLLWAVVPIVKSIRFTDRKWHADENSLKLMVVIGIVGIAIFIGWFIYKLIKSSNKKEFLKKIIPIFFFTAYMIWTLVSCIFAENKKNVFEGTGYRKEGYFMYLNYAGFFLCAFLLDSDQLRKIILNTIIVVTTLMAILSLCVSMKINPVFFNMYFVNTSRKTAYFSQFNHYGYFLMISLMACFGMYMTEKNKKIKVLYLISFAFISYMLIYNNTFGCYLAVTISLILYTIYVIIKKKNIVTTLCAILIFVILSCTVKENNINLAYYNIKGIVKDIKAIVTRVINIKEDDDEIEKDFEKAGTNRVKLWKYGLQFFAENPILGYGPDNLDSKYDSVGIIDQDRPHNLLIQLATTSGLPGLILYVTAVGIIIIKGIKEFLKKDEKGQIFLLVVITYLISAMFGNSMYYTSPYFFIFLGFLMNSNFYDKKELKG